MTTLDRVEPKAETPNELLKIAEAQLGYTGMNVATLKPSTVKALREAGVRPFDAGQVERYMRDQSYSANQWLAVTWIVASAVLLLSLPVASLLFWNLWPLALLPVAALAWIAITCGLATLDKTWQYTPLSSYSGEVPAYALQTAVDTRNALSENGIPWTNCIFSLGSAFFEIAHLDKRGYPDPFLVLNIDGQRLYLEVWDEPGFTKERKF